MHVSDCVDGLMYGYSHSRQKINLFNLGAESSTCLSAVAYAVIHEMELPGVNVIFDPQDRGWPGDIPYLRYDMSQMRELGWCAKLSSDEAVRLAAREHIAELA